MNLILMSLSKKPSAQRSETLAIGCKFLQQTLVLSRFLYALVEEICAKMNADEKQKFKMAVGDS